MPSEERQVKKKELPFIPAHELPGQGESVFAADLWIFREYVRDQDILVVLDDPADDRKIPQELEKGAAEHDPCRMTFAAEFVQEEDLGDRRLPVTAVLKKEAPLSDDQNVADKDLIKKCQ